MKKFLVLWFICLWVPGVPIPSSAESIPDDMVLIKAGCFMMGTDKIYNYEPGWENDRERPAHKVCVDSFYLDQFEVSQKKWEDLMGYNNSVYFGPDLPISGLDYPEAKAYCKKRGHRLPTEAEWEYAARAGTQTRNPWGDDINDEYLWYGGNSFRKFPKIGTKKPNAWGLHDMMGSVWEWVNDWYSESYYKNSPVKNPQGPLKRTSYHVIRGASWLDEEEYIRVTIRTYGMADPTLDYWVGVRCAHTPSR